MPSDFDFITNYGSIGTGKSNFTNPQGIVTDGTYLYVADQGNHRLLKLVLHGGAFVKQVGITGTSGSGDTDFNSLNDVHLFKDRLFVADSVNDTIKVFNQDLVFIKSFGTVDSPVSFTDDGENLYVSDSNNHRIVVYDRNLNLNFTFGSNGSGNNNFNAPKGIHFDKQEKFLYVVDVGNTRVSQFQNTGSTLKFIDSLVAADSTDSSIAGLNDITVKDHYLYLIESARIQVFDTVAFTTRGNAGSSGSGNSNISAGRHIINFRDTLIFSESGNDRISIWNNYKPERAFDSGETIKIFGGFFQNPVVAIGGKQERVDVTIGGTATADKIISVEEEELNDNYMNVEEI